MRLRWIKCLLCMILVCSCVSTATAEGINLSTTAESPLAVISASSSTNAARAAILLYLAAGIREDATIETCVVKTLSDSTIDGIDTMELYALDVTFGKNTDKPKLSSGAYFVKLQLSENEDGTFSLLSFFTPEEGDNLYKEVTEYFTDDASQVLMSQQDELMEQAQTEALAVWEQYYNKESDEDGTDMIVTSISTSEIQESDDPNLRTGQTLSSVDNSLIQEYEKDGISNVWIAY